MKRYFCLLIAIFLFSLTACETQTSAVKSDPPITVSPTVAAGNTKATPITLEAIAMRETIYVPIYPQIYYLENRTVTLTAALSIRNTDLVNPIVLSSVGYYDGEGKLVKQYLNCSSSLAPLASVEFLAIPTKPTKSIGTSFIVEWVAEQTVNPPIVEGVMLSTTSGQGISFTSIGRVIQNPKTLPVKLCQ